MNQSKLGTNTCDMNRWKTFDSEPAVTTGLVFTSNWLKKWREIFKSNRLKTKVAWIYFRYSSQVTSNPSLFHVYKHVYRQFFSYIYILKCTNFSHALLKFCYVSLQNEYNFNCPCKQYAAINTAIVSNVQIVIKLTAKSCGIASKISWNNTD